MRHSDGSSRATSPPSRLLSPQKKTEPKGSVLAYRCGKDLLVGAVQIAQLRGARTEVGRQV